MIAPLRAFRRPQGGLAGGWLILVIAAALAAPLLTPYAYDVQNLPQAYQPASARHWLGTDEFGRDLLTRLIYGARTSLSVSATAISISVLCGMVLGADGALAPPAARAFWHAVFGGWVPADRDGWPAVVRLSSPADAAWLVSAVASPT